MKYISMLKWLLSPFALVYGAVATARNILFDLGVLKSKSYDVPVVVVGNITVGGTGKTPHIEYLSKLLSGKCRLAVVSRGYGRSTKGFLDVNVDSKPQNVGDEPLQIKRKFPNVVVAVDEVRTDAIDKLLDGDAANVFLLDDAFQHRYVKAGMNIVLVDYNRPLFSDMMMPSGRLREPRRNINRADIIVVTKCPKLLPEEKQFDFVAHLHLNFNQPVFFTTFSYGNLVPICGSEPVDTIDGVSVLAVTGISQPERMYQYLRECGAKVSTLEFADHHSFTHADVLKICEAYHAVGKGVVVLTEKDAVRLTPDLLAELVNIPLYYLPVQVEFLSDAVKFTNLVSEFCNVR